MARLPTPRRNDRRTLLDILETVWHDAILRGLPPITRFEHGWDSARDQLWMRLVTPITPQLWLFGYADLYGHELNPLLMNSRSLAKKIDHRLRALKASHHAHVTVLTAVCLTLDDWMPQ